MENDIPKIDLPDDWIIGNLSHKDIGLLSLYANYPCRLKAEIFVLCMQGEIEASINLTRYQVKPGSFITEQSYKFIKWKEICRSILWVFRPSSPTMPI